VKHGGVRAQRLHAVLVARRSHLREREPPRVDRVGEREVARGERTVTVDSSPERPDGRGPRLLRAFAQRRRFLDITARHLQPRQRAEHARRPRGHGRRRDGDGVPIGRAPAVLVVPHLPIVDELYRLRQRRDARRGAANLGVRASRRDSRRSQPPSRLRSNRTPRVAVDYRCRSRPRRWRCGPSSQSLDEGIRRPSSRHPGCICSRDPRAASGSHLAWSRARRCHTSRGFQRHRCQHRTRRVLARRIRRRRRVRRRRPRSIVFEPTNARRSGKHIRVTMRAQSRG
jgi:hypothetical protein